VVISLERGEDLHMAQLMPLPLTVSCFSKIQVGLPFWYRLTWVVTEKGLLNGCCCCILLFYPRDAMLATGTTVAMALCLCLSQVGVLKKRLDESSWFLAWGLLSTCPTLCFKEIQISSKIRVLFSGTLLQTRGISIVEACCQLSARKVDAQSVINWPSSVN